MQGQVLEDLAGQVAQLVTAQAAMQAFLARETRTAAAQAPGQPPGAQPQQRPGTEQRKHCGRPGLVRAAAARRRRRLRPERRDGGLAQGSSPLAQIAATQALMATLLAERQNDIQCGLGGSGGEGGSCARGVQLVMKNRQRFLSQSEAKWEDLNNRFREQVHWRPGMLCSMHDLMQRWPCGYQRMLKRAGFMLARTHSELLVAQPN